MLRLAGLTNYMKQLGLTHNAQIAQLQISSGRGAGHRPVIPLPVGQTLDINVSSLGNAKSLKGGTLGGTSQGRRRGLRVCQGNLIVAGAGAAGGSKVAVSRLSVSHILKEPRSARRSTSLPEGGGVSLSLNLGLSDRPQGSMAVNRKIWRRRRA